jgi:hypothetical protein
MFFMVPLIIAACRSITNSNPSELTNVTNSGGSSVGIGTGILLLLLTELYLEDILTK